MMSGPEASYSALHASEPDSVLVCHIEIFNCSNTNNVRFSLPQRSSRCETICHIQYLRMVAIRMALLQQCARCVFSRKEVTWTSSTRFAYLSLDSALLRTLLVVSILMPLSIAITSSTPSLPCRNKVSTSLQTKSHTYTAQAVVPTSFTTYRDLHNCHCRSFLALQNKPPCHASRIHYHHRKCYSATDSDPGKYHNFQTFRRARMVFVHGQSDITKRFSADRLHGDFVMGITSEHDGNFQHRQLDRTDTDQHRFYTSSPLGS